MCRWYCELLVTKVTTTTGTTTTVTSTKTCAPGTWHCPATDVCWPAKFQCNGFGDCKHNGVYVDEAGCSTTTKATPSTLRPYGCINRDPSDTGKFFMCRNRKCIKPSLVCDGFDDCTDGALDNRGNRVSGSDENLQNCPVAATTTTKKPTTIAVAFCTTSQVRCSRQNLCINKAYLCNGVVDCDEDGSDEVGCTTITTTTTKLTTTSTPTKKTTTSTVTATTKTTATTITTRTTRTTVTTVTTRTTVTTVTTTTSTSTTTSSTRRPCDTETEWTCEDKGCIRKIYLCNKLTDCADNSDERWWDGAVCHQLTTSTITKTTLTKTTATTSTKLTTVTQAATTTRTTQTTKPRSTTHTTKTMTTTPPVCGGHQFLCSVKSVGPGAISKCLPKEYQCNGAQDCVDNSDELAVRNLCML